MARTIWTDVRRVVPSLMVHHMHHMECIRQASAERILIRMLQQDEVQQQLNGPEMMDVLVRHEVEVWENEIEYRLSV